MSASLAEKIRRSRERTVEINGITFVFHRPTDVQMAALREEFGNDYSKPEIARRYVFGWRNCTEDKLLPGGNPDEAVKFEREAFEEFLDDARDYWTPLFEAILGAYVEYSNDRDGKVKNSQPG